MNARPTLASRFQAAIGRSAQQKPTSAATAPAGAAEPGESVRPQGRNHASAVGHLELQLVAAELVAGGRDHRGQEPVGLEDLRDPDGGTQGVAEEQHRHQPADLPRRLQRLARPEHG